MLILIFLLNLSRHFLSRWGMRAVVRRGFLPFETFLLLIFPPLESFLFILLNENLISGYGIFGKRFVNLINYRWEWFRDAERVDCKELNRFLRKYGIKLETINRTNYSRVPSKARNTFDIPCNKLSVVFTKEHLGPTQIKKINRLLADDLARFSYPIL